MRQQAPRNMQITTDDLENRADPSADAVGVSSEPPTIREFEALKARIDLARQVMPLPAERHCLDCFKKGRDAAIRAIVGDT